MDPSRCFISKFRAFFFFSLTDSEHSCVAVDGLCTIAGHVGRELAPHVKKHGAKLIPESIKKDKDGRSNIDGAMVVAASGVQGNVTCTAL